MDLPALPAIGLTMYLQLRFQFLSCGPAQDLGAFIYIHLLDLQGELISNHPLEIPQVNQVQGTRIILPGIPLNLLAPCILFPYCA